MVAMAGLRSPTNPVPLVTPALQETLQALADGTRGRSYTIVMPRIGSGFAGGTWETISPLVEAQLKGIPTVVYTKHPNTTA